MGPGIVTESNACQWTAERLVEDGDQYVVGLEQACDTARSSITCEVYILDNDVVGQRIYAALSRAAARGVAVRLLVDGFGSAAWISSIRVVAVGGPCQIRIFHPLPWQVFTGIFPPTSITSRFSAALRFMNQRNHRKIVIIDATEAWVGSFNFERRHSVSIVGDQAWKDMAVRVQGPGIIDLQRAFDHAWRRSWSLSTRILVPHVPRLQLKPEHAKARAFVRVWRGFLLRRRLRRDFINRINTAEHRVWLRTPYFVPPLALTRALGKAAQRGVDVRIVIPTNNDVRFMPWIAILISRILSPKGVKMLLFPRMLHAKTILIDDWATVGSLNLNGRSLHRDLEVEVVLSHLDTRTALVASFESDANQAVLITPTSVHLRWWQVLSARCALIFRWFI